MNWIYGHSVENAISIIWFVSQIHDDGYGFCSICKSNPITVVNVSTQKYFFIIIMFFLPLHHFRLLFICRYVLF